MSEKEPEGSGERSVEMVGARYFICGEGGPRDKSGLPETIFVSPAEGVDWFVVYRRAEQRA